MKVGLVGTVGLCAGMGRGELRGEGEGEGENRSVYSPTRAPPLP